MKGSITYLHVLRIESGISQKKVCTTLHIPQSTIDSYERGRSIPRIDVAEQIADLLDYHGTFKELFRKVE